jgi:hypothetical protein
MTGRYEKTFGWNGSGPNPLDDALVAAWDAVVRGDHSTPAGCDPMDTMVIQRVHALETIPPPGDTFFIDLERQLTRLAPLPVVAPTPAPDATPARRSITSWGGAHAGASGGHAVRGRRLFSRTPSRPVAMQAAAVLLVLLLVAGSLVLYRAPAPPPEQPAIPAAVVSPAAMETLMHFTFASPPWGMPAATGWNHMELSLFTVAPGASFSTDMRWYTGVDGPLVIIPLGGELVVQPNGPALVYRSGANPPAPVESPAGEPVTLGRNDAIVFWSQDTAQATNPGAEPVGVLYGLTGVNQYGASEPVIEPHDVKRVDIIFVDHLSPLPGAGASVSIRHLRLAPMDTFVYEIEPGLRIAPVSVPLQINDLRVYDGVLDGLSPGFDSHLRYASIAKLQYPEPGPHTLVNVGNDTVDLYFMVLEPYPDAATPPA